MKRKKKNKVLLILMAVLIIIICVVGFVYLKYKNIWDNPTESLKLGANEDGYKDSVVNLVLIGTDNDSERDAANKGIRTDTLVICAIDTIKNTARCITVPRDTYAMINVVNSQGVVVGEDVNRINAAYMLGVHGNAGSDYQNTLDALSDLLGNQKIPLKYYAAINMDGIIPIADAVGGVPVVLDVTIPGVGQEGEKVLLKGETAESYVRVRKGYASLDGSDLSRAKRQQAFFLGIAQRIKELGPLNAIPRLWGNLQQYIETNMSLDEMVAFASILNRMDIASIAFVMPAGTTGMLDGKSLFFPDEEELQNLALDIWFDLPKATSLWTSSPRRTPSGD